jgi:hypothetical protein
MLAQPRWSPGPIAPPRMVDLLQDGFSRRQLVELWRPSSVDYGIQRDWKRLREDGRAAGFPGSSFGGFIGQFCHFTTGNGRDAAAVTSSFLSTNPLANTSGGPQLYRHKFLAGCWGPGWSLSAMRSENLHGLSLSTLRLRLKTMHCKATPHPGK